MGTANSYGGSGGAWIGAVSDLMDWLDTLPDGSDNSTAEPESPEPASDGDADDDVGPQYADTPERKRAFRSFARALQSGATQGGVVGQGGSGGTHRPSNATVGGRSGRTAGRVGGRTGAGVTAYRASNSADLQALGLSLQELDAMDSDYQKAARIADAASDGVPTSIQDEELRRASAATAIWGLQQFDDPTPIDLVRRFLEEYLYRIILVELGAQLRNGVSDRDTSLPAEGALRTTIRAMIRQLPVSPAGNGAIDMGDAIESTYQRIVDIWAADE